MVLASLEDDKAEDVLPIDLRGRSSIADHMVIATGRSARHVGAICDHLIEKVKDLRGAKPSAEGVEAGDWGLIDLGDVIVHVFRQEVRDFYALEKMWSPETASRAAAASGEATNTAATPTAKDAPTDE